MASDTGARQLENEDVCGSKCLEVDVSEWSMAGSVFEGLCNTYKKEITRNAILIFFMSSTS